MCRASSCLLLYAHPPYLCQETRCTQSTQCRKTRTGIPNRSICSARHGGATDALNWCGPCVPNPNYAEHRDSCDLEVKRHFGLFPRSEHVLFYHALIVRVDPSPQSHATMHTPEKKTRIPVLIIFISMIRHGSPSMGNSMRRMIMMTTRIASIVLL